MWHDTFGFQEGVEQGGSARRGVLNLGALGALEAGKGLGIETGN